MRTRRWFTLLSLRQRVILFLTIGICLCVTGMSFFMTGASLHTDPVALNPEMSIRQIAQELEVTGAALARELGLPLDVSKTRPLRELNITEGELAPVADHLLSHVDATPKYYVFAVLVLAGTIYLVLLGRPESSDIRQRKDWYPRLPYNLVLILSVLVAGFYFGKSPNPMEGVVKVFKSMVGLYPDPAVKVAALLFFLLLAVIAEKAICGWACPFGALQELLYSIPVMRRIRGRKLPFALTNLIRAVLFVTALLFLFGAIGSNKGFVLYHNINPFNLFDLDLESLGISLTVVIALGGSFFTYRPFCQFVCPFGFISWIFERFSITRVHIDRGICTRCGACFRVCPLDAAKDRVHDTKLKAECFSCARCLNVCPVDAIQYGFAPAKRSRLVSPGEAPMISSPGEPNRRIDH